MRDPIRLTQFSHGAGCGCKIAPNLLTQILQSNVIYAKDENLLVGNDSRDDAAVYDLGDGSAIISTTDFFMPIVDDPTTFGRIAATNAISDIYAMGGHPMLAIAILGWPIEKLPADVAQKVLEGGRRACSDAGIMLAGGHSIDSPEPIFGLAVTGRVQISQLKRNNTAQEGNHLYLSKPLGVGVLATAQKKGILHPGDLGIATQYMMQLNKIGLQLSNIPGVTAMTDVTGFGLLGHLVEMCQGSQLSATIDTADVPIIPKALQYINAEAIPGGTHRNWKSYGHHISIQNLEDRLILCDPQTSGGLMIAVSDTAREVVEDLLIQHKMPAKPFGQLSAKKTHWIEVKHRATL